MCLNFFGEREPSSGEGELVNLTVSVPLTCLLDQAHPITDSYAPMEQREARWWDG